MIPNPNEFQQLLQQAGTQTPSGASGIPDLSSAFPDLENLPQFSLDFGSKKSNSLVGQAIRGNASGKLTPLNPVSMENQAVAADTLGYDLSDQDWAKRFPLLKAGRDYNIEDAQLNLTGQEDPFVKSALLQSGLSGAKFGGKGEYNAARNLGIPIASKENRDRQYFQTLLQDNPQRAFGLNGGDMARIAEANSGGQSALSLGLSQTRTTQALSDINASAQNNAALIASFGQLAGAGIKANPNLFGGSSAASPELNPGYYNSGFGYNIPNTYNPGSVFGYGDPYSGNYYDASGNYAGNSFTGG